jgi:thiamine-phosphate pyrophosphorylase
LLLYYITDRTQFPGDEAIRRRRVLEKIAEATRFGVDYVQLRERDLPTRGLEALARDAMEVLRGAAKSRSETGNHRVETRLLINSRSDIALAVGADGVHLRSDDISPSDVQKIWNQCGHGRLVRAIVGVSCHSLAEVARAAAGRADLAVFAPIFEKKSEEENVPDALPTGLENLRQACQQDIPVLALGGITLENAGACLEAGAAGMAGIRLFQGNEIRKVVEVLRTSAPH